MKQEKQTLLKMGQPRPLFHLFWSFQTNVTILTTNKCDKCLSSIRRLDSNSQPSDYKSPPLSRKANSWHLNLVSKEIFEIPFGTAAKAAETETEEDKSLRFKTIKCWLNKILRGSGDQCDQFGQFLNFLVANNLIKATQIILRTKITLFLNKNYCG